jgi:lysozyme
MTPLPRVIDLSHHNVVRDDLKAAKSAGVVGVIHKLTEGDRYIDDKVVSRYFLAKDAGLAWGIYHFMRPGDMEYQAKFFLDTAHELGVIDYNTVLVADHEDEEVPGQDLIDWLEAVEEMSGRSVVVYSGHVAKEQLTGSSYSPTRRLWLCHYAPTPVLPEGVDSYWLWQYTDEGTIPGVDPPTDLNHFDGDELAFLQGWSGAFVPQPEPELIRVTVDVLVNSPPGVEVSVNVRKEYT